MFLADHNGENLGPGEALETDVRPVAVIDQLGDRSVVRQGVTGPVQQLQRMVEGGDQLLCIRFTHRPHQFRGTSRDPGAVAEGSGRQREGQRNIAGGCGQRLGEQMRQM